MTCGSWLSLGWSFGHEVAVTCKGDPGHGGDHYGYRDGRRFTWVAYYARR